jgi:hypothetical protein
VRVQASRASLVWRARQKEARAARQAAEPEPQTALLREASQARSLPAVLRVQALPAQMPPGLSPMARPLPAEFARVLRETP